MMVGSLSSSRGAVLAVLVACAVGGVGAGLRSASGEQILQPRQEQGAGPAILGIERIARLTLRLPVERQVAYDAWTDANQLVEWFPHWAEITVTEGGAFEIGWEGYEGVWQGTYLVVDRPARLSFTWLPPAEVFPAGAYETIVDLRFEQADGGGTVMTLEHTGFEDADTMEAQLQAWRGYLFALRAFLLQAPAS